MSDEQQRRQAGGPGQPPPWQAGPQWQGGPGGQPQQWWQPASAQHPQAPWPPADRLSSSYGGLGVFDSPKPKRPKKPWLIAAAVVVLLGGGAAAWQLGAFRGDVLDQKSVQDGVRQVLREDFGEGDLRDASCPANEPVKTATTFECSVTVAGQPKKVTVRVLNEQAQVEVGAPK